MNSPDKMPCCMHPVTVPCVDDEHKSLIDLAMGMNLPSLQYALCRFQLKAKEMLELANASYKPIDPVCTIYNAKRFDLPAVFVVDYNMGKAQMNGLDFCASVRRPSVRRFTWSQHLPDKQAMHAVNKGHLHGSVSKNVKDSAQKVSSLIEQGIPAFFCQETGTFAKAGEQANSPLKDPIFVQWFVQFLYKMQFMEYYLINPVGTLMMVGANKEIYGLRALTAHQMDKEAQEAEKNGASTYVVQSLKSHEAMLCMPHLDQQKITKPMDWLKFLYPVTDVLSGGQEPYFLCHSYNLLMVDTSKVLSLQQYRDSNPY